MVQEPAAPWQARRRCWGILAASEALKCWKQPAAIPGSAPGHRPAPLQLRSQTTTASLAQRTGDRAQAAVGDSSAQATQCRCPAPPSCVSCCVLCLLSRWGLTREPCEHGAVSLLPSPSAMSKEKKRKPYSGVVWSTLQLQTHWLAVVSTEAAWAF